MFSLLTASDYEWIGKSVGGRSGGERGPDSRRRHNLSYAYATNAILGPDTGFLQILLRTPTDSPDKQAGKRAWPKHFLIMAHANVSRCAQSAGHLILDTRPLKLLLINNDGPTSFVSKNTATIISKAFFVVGTYSICRTGS